MPLYEYRCRTCGKISTILQGVTMVQPDIVCASCGGTDLFRLISRVRHVLGEEERMERMLDPSSLSGLDENDPRSIARWARSMGKSMGDELGEDFGELVDEMEDAASKDMEDGDGSSGESTDEFE